MAQVKDPVCGMMIEPAAAAGLAVHQGRTYHFCSTTCRELFEENPDKFVSDARR